MRDGLPMATAGLGQCGLDTAGLQAQAERYARAGRGAVTLERTPARLVVRLDAGVAPGRVEELLAVERDCCPFFEIEWESVERRLAISVAEEEHEPALAAIALAMGVDAASG